MAILFMAHISAQAADQPILLSDNFDDGILSSNWSFTGDTVREEDGILKILTNQTDNGGVLSSTPFKLPEGVLTLTRKVKLHYGNEFAMPWISLSYRDGLNALNNLFSIYYGQMSYNGAPHQSVYGTFLAPGNSSPHSRESGGMTVKGSKPVLWNEWFDETITYDRSTGKVRYSGNGMEIEGTAPILPAETPVWLMISAWGWYTGHSHFMDDLEVSSDEVITPTLVPPVVFFPGIAGSRLYTQEFLNPFENQLWLPNDNEEDICKLKAETASFGDRVYTKSRDNGGLIEEAVISGFPSKINNIYKDLTRTLDGFISDGVIEEWEAFPYDWRRDVRDIANYIDGAHHTGIIYGNSGTIEEHADLVGKIIELKQRSGPVTIIGHSNGGLLAKAVVNEIADRFGKENVKNYVGRVILVGVPQLGTPEGLLATLHGAFAPELMWTSQNAKREAAETMPGALGLLPSKEFFNRVTGSIIEFSPTILYSNDLLDQFKVAYGASINHTNFDKYTDFLKGINSANSTQFRQQPHNEKCEDTPKNSYLTPNVFSDSTYNGLALNVATHIHNVLDHWTPPAGVEVVQIVGQGLATTRGIIYSADNKKMIEYTPINSYDGDGIVLSVSAAALNTPTFWVNLNSAYSGAKDHGTLMEDSAVHDTIRAILKYGGNVDLEKIGNTRVTRTPDTGKYLNSRWTMKSPVDMQIYDDQGNHTGIIRSNGQPYSTRNIPGSTIRNISGHQVINLAGDRLYNVVLDGIDNGTFTLEVETFHGEDLVKKDVFTALPATQQTKGTLTMSPEMVLSQLSLDYNGDGQIDSTIDPVSPDTKGYSHALTALGDYIRTLGLDHGIQQALLSSVNAALNAVNPNAAKDNLVALSNKLSALSGKKIAPETESALKIMLAGIFAIL
ncbi:MAG TPA: hypothetical protein PK517_01145 [Nitrosomonas sp.]|nr:hypothetical protein [Nitrosomonas sp.]